MLLVIIFQEVNNNKCLKICKCHKDLIKVKICQCSKDLCHLKICNSKDLLHLKICKCLKDIIPLQIFRTKAWIFRMQTKMSNNNHNLANNKILLILFKISKIHNLIKDSNKIKCTNQIHNNNKDTKETNNSNNRCLNKTFNNNRCLKEIFICKTCRILAVTNPNKNQIINQFKETYQALLLLIHMIRKNQ